MASSSSPSSLPRYWKHHVFPSFHGPDVRKTFLSHLLKEFRRKGIDTFTDNNIERSKSISLELIEAIRGSRIAIVLLSKNYASSTWCLDELVEIIKCREELGQTVMVLFYDVDPTDVKKHTGEFGNVFRKTCKGKTKEQIERWKQALAQVATIAGYHSRDWDNDAQMIETIATYVSNKLNSLAPSNDFDGLVGMESHMINMGPLLRLDLDEVRMIGIWCLSGIGKTIIARFLYNRYSEDYFQLSVFMENIKTSYPNCSDDYEVKFRLQEQLMSKIINRGSFKIPHLGIIKDRLKEKKVLIVLDDVDQVVQLEALVKETSWFGRGSRIIITTQDRKILQAHGVNHRYKVDFPSSSEALQMFCMYAFGQKSPKDGFTELAWEVTELVGELPLGLRIMGTYFRGMSKQDWTTALPRLMTRLDREIGDIESILKFNYDALYDRDKALFLHIACFFENESVDTLEGCLANSFLDVMQGLHALTEKSLININDGIIEMHKLLVQLGREIVRKQSVSKPGNRQFLVEARDINEVLSDDKADCSEVLGLCLMPRDHEKEIIKCSSERAFERFRNLHFLRVHDYSSTTYFQANLNSISPKLRYLTWNHFPMPCFPSGFQPEFLVKLAMIDSELEILWEGIQPLSNLKWMNLSLSKRLKEVPDLVTATNLCELDLSGCSSLVKLPSSIGNAISLQKLNLEYCLSLVELPCSTKSLCKLSELKLKGCSKLEVCLTNINLESLEELDLSDCSLLKSDTETSTNIEDLKSSGTVIKEVSSLSLLSELEMSNSQIQELGPLSWRVSILRRLTLSRMRMMVSLPQLPYSLDYLDAEDCESLERLYCSFRNPEIRRLNFAKCHKLNQEARDLIIHARTSEYAVLPGGEVPACFTYRASGSSLTVKLNYKPLHTSTKFKVCLTLACENDYEDWEKDEVDCTITSKQNDVAVHTLRLIPFPEHMYIFEVEAEEVTSTELVFEFEVEEDTWKIRECGVMQFLEGPSCDEFGDGGEDSDMEIQILKPKLDRESSGE